MRNRHALRLWTARFLIGVVVFFNLQCAAVFILWPQSYAPAFELSGEVGSAMIRAMGILFVMWNVPYVFALIHPVRNRLSLIEACLMQSVGVIGESLLLLSLSPGHTLLAASTLRFIVFDGAGLLCLLAAVWISRAPGRELPAHPA